MIGRCDRLRVGGREKHDGVPMLRGEPNVGGAFPHPHSACVHDHELLEVAGEAPDRALVERMKHAHVQEPDAETFELVPVQAQVVEGGLELAVERSSGDQPHDNMPPYQAVNFIIVLQGIFRREIDHIR